MTKTGGTATRWAKVRADFNAERRTLGRLIRRKTENLFFQGMGSVRQIMRSAGFQRPLEPAVHFVYLHHVFADEIRPFRELLEILTRDAALIGHSAAVEKIKAGDIDQCYVSISFDDGLRACCNAAKVLDEFQATGMFFVCPGVVERCKDDTWLAHWCKHVLHKAPAEVMSWDDLENLQASGHEIGNHTMSHANLAELPAEARRAELFAARDALLSRLGQQAGRHFAWPYGERRHIDVEAIADVFSAGHETCASAVRGVHLAGPRLDKTPVLLRNHVSFDRPITATMYFMDRNVRRHQSRF